MRFDIVLYMLATPSLAVLFNDGYGEDQLFEEKRFPLDVSLFCKLP